MSKIWGLQLPVDAMYTGHWRAGGVMEYMEIILTVVTIATAVTLQTANAQEGDYSGKYFIPYVYLN